MKIVGGFNLRGAAGLRREQQRLVIFLLILVGIFTYLNWKWGEFTREALFGKRERSPEGAVLVNTPGGTREPGGSGSDFYAETRLERDKLRSEQIQILKETVAGKAAADGLRSSAQSQLLALVRRSEREAEIESLIRAKGYDDALVFLHERGAVIVVKTNRLEAKDVARLADVAANVAGLNFTDIKVMAYD